MYTDDNGAFKGEALVVYFRPESVNLAIQMLDDSDFRIGQTGLTGAMRVQAADFSFKSQREAPVQSNNRDKKKIIARTQKLNRCVILTFILGSGLGFADLDSKLADWDDDDPSIMANTSSKLEKVVILKHMFTLDEIKVRLHLVKGIIADI